MRRVVIISKTSPQDDNFSRAYKAGGLVGISEGERRGGMEDGGNFQTFFKQREMFLQRKQSLVALTGKSGVK